MNTGRGADIIDFAAAARSVRLRRRRSELQRLRAALAQRLVPAMRAWLPLMPMMPAAPARHAGAR